MNKRLFLNIMIVALLTFYMIFNIVYRQLVDKHEPEQEQEPVVDVWQRPFMVPDTWHLTRLEMSSITLHLDNNGDWSETTNHVDSATAAKIALSWQSLEAEQITNYQQLPLEGITILAFIAEDSQPLVFRAIEQAEAIHFYRMIDQKQFRFPISSKSSLLPE